MNSFFIFNREHFFLYNKSIIILLYFDFIQERYKRPAIILIVFIIEISIIKYYILILIQV